VGQNQVVVLRQQPGRCGHVGAGPRAVRQVEQLPALLVGEDPQPIPHRPDDLPQPGQPRPGLHVLDGGRAERGQVPLDHDLERRLVRERPAQPHVDRRVPGQTGLPPDRARRYLHQRDPGPHHLGQGIGRLTRPVLSQQFAQLGEGQRVLGRQGLARHRHRGLVHAGQPLAEVGGQGPVQDRLDQRPQHQGVVRADQVDGAAHERDPHHVPADQQAGQVLGPEAVQPGQQAVVGRERRLGLQADQVLDHGQGRSRGAGRIFEARGTFGVFGAGGMSGVLEADGGRCGDRLALQQVLAGQQGPVERAAAEHFGHGRPPPGRLG
jgi:hypothetical protein